MWLEAARIPGRNQEPRLSRWPSRAVLSFNLGDIIIPEEKEALVQKGYDEVEAGNQQL